LDVVEEMWSSEKEAGQGNTDGSEVLDEILRAFSSIGEVVMVFGCATPGENTTFWVPGVVPVL
jgi:hypothetical protein